MEVAYLARRFIEHFGDGAASYVQVRDEFSADEHDAWLAFFTERDRTEAERKAQEEHDAVMKAATDAAMKAI
jgi:AraC-like DNA-binding protein